MESKSAAILVVAVAAALLIAASATYAMMGWQTQGPGSSYPNDVRGYRTGPSMMGGSGGYAGGMMGGYGMMGDSGSMYRYMQQHMYRYWNSTTSP